MPSSKGENLKNPGLIKQVKGGWEGSDGADEFNHARFIAVKWGCRATIRCWAAKYLNGKTNLTRIIGSWADVTDTQGSVPMGKPNDPFDYAAFLSKRVSVGTDEDLKLFFTTGEVAKHDLLFRLLIAQERWENGYFWVKRSQWYDGLAEYQRSYPERNN